MRSKIKIQGSCPNCGEEGYISIRDVNVYWSGELSHIHKDLPICHSCDCDVIIKINNRRYKVHEIQGDEYYESDC